jgi:hypothetical protein
MSPAGFGAPAAPALPLAAGPPLEPPPPWHAATATATATAPRSRTRSLRFVLSFFMAATVPRLGRRWIAETPQRRVFGSNGRDRLRAARAAMAIPRPTRCQRSSRDELYLGTDGMRAGRRETRAGTRRRRDRPCRRAATCGLRQHGLQRCSTEPGCRPGSDASPPGSHHPVLRGSLHDKAAPSTVDPNFILPALNPRTRSKRVFGTNGNA